MQQDRLVAGSFGNRILAVIKVNKVPFNLTGYNVYIRVKKRGESLARFERICSVDDTGQVIYIIQPGDFDSAGYYEIEYDLQSSIDETVNVTTSNKKLVEVREPMRTF